MCPHISIIVAHMILKNKKKYTNDRDERENRVWDKPSLDFTPPMQIKGWACLFLAKSLWKNGLDEAKTTLCAGLHKLWYPGIRDMSTWSKFGAHGEHGDVFLFSNLGAL